MGDSPLSKHTAFTIRAELAINEFGRVYFTNDGMEMRGTRPIKDDPDSLLRLVPGGPGTAGTITRPTWSQ